MKSKFAQIISTILVIVLIITLYNGSLIEPLPFLPPSSRPKSVTEPSKSPSSKTRIPVQKLQPQPDHSMEQKKKRLIPQYVKQQSKLLSQPILFDDPNKLPISRPISLPTLSGRQIEKKQTFEQIESATAIFERLMKDIVAIPTAPNSPPYSETLTQRLIDAINDPIMGPFIPDAVVEKILQDWAGEIPTFG